MCEEDGWLEWKVAVGWKIVASWKTLAVWKTSWLENKLIRKLA